MNPNELTPSDGGNKNHMVKSSPSTNTNNRLSPNYVSNMPTIDENNSEYFDSNTKL